jgi:hypothetical protein
MGHKVEALISKSFVVLSQETFGLKNSAKWQGFSGERTKKKNTPNFKGILSVFPPKKENEPLCV